MTSVEPDIAFERLDTDSCRALLAGEVVGRLAVVTGGRPAIFPVNYTLDGNDIVFRTNPGTKFDAGSRAPVCFEIDMFDRVRRTGWSVVVTGRLEEVTPYDGPAWRRIQELALEPWGPTPRSYWMRLIPDWISGRSIGRSSSHTS